MPVDMVPAGAPTRESIEVRALVFTYPANQRRSSSTVAVPHPLAVQLKQSNLKRIDDEHSLTDRIRTDIDEGNEVKDAALLLRRQKIRTLEALNTAITSERDSLSGQLMKATTERDCAQTELVRSQKQSAIQTPRIVALEAEVKRLKQQLSQAPRGRDDNTTFSPDSRGRDAQERMYLLQTIQRQDQEIQQWKREAMGCGSLAVSKSWQGSVVSFPVYAQLCMATKLMLTRIAG